jgi:hypothetical protein
MVSGDWNSFIVITFGLQANASQGAAPGAQPNGVLIATLGALAAGVLVIGAVALWAAERLVDWNVTGAMALPLVGSVAGGVVLAAIVLSAQATAPVSG